MDDKDGWMVRDKQSGNDQGWDSIQTEGEIKHQCCS